MLTPLAQRLQRIRPSPTVSITARAIELREEGRDIISLSAGEPDFETPQHIKSAAIEAIRAGDTKYTAVGGTRRLKQAIAAKFLHDNDLEFRLDQILVSNGAKQACFNLCQALLDPGDEVAIPAPYWVSYPDMVRFAEAEPVILPTTAASGFKITPEQLAQAITPRTRLLMLNSPSNPTGAVYSRAELTDLAAVLERHPRVFVMSDDIYEKICWDTQPFSTIAQAAPAMQERTLTINGMSKCYAMSGWRVGYAAGPRELIAAMTSLQSQSTTNACSVSQAAACAALTGDQTAVAEMARTFRQRHDYLIDGLNSIDGIECAAGHGAFYLFPDITGLMARGSYATDTELCEALLERAGLALVPGSAFGAPGHLRISFAAAQSTLAGALDRLDSMAPS